MSHVYFRDCDIPTDDPTDDCTPEILVAAENTLVTKKKLQY